MTFDGTPEETLTHSEALRDKILEWVPEPARILGLEFQGKFRFGDMIIEICYDPDESLLDLAIHEPVYQSLDAEESALMNGYLCSGIEMDLSDGEVNGVSTNLIPQDEEVGEITTPVLEFMASVRGTFDINELSKEREAALIEALSFQAILDEKARHPFPE